MTGSSTRGAAATTRIRSPWCRRACRSVTSTASVLVLGARDFTALLARRDPAAFRLKRRLASQFTARLRNQLGHLAATLAAELPVARADDAERTFAELEFRGPPNSRYLSRIARFHEF